MISNPQEVLGKDGKCGRCKLLLLRGGAPEVAVVSITVHDLSEMIRGVKTSKDFFGGQPGGLAISDALGLVPTSEIKKEVSTHRLCPFCTASLSNWMQKGQTVKEKKSEQEIQEIQDDFEHQALSQRQRRRRQA